MKHKPADRSERDLRAWARDQRFGLRLFAVALGVFAGDKLAVEYRLGVNIREKMNILILLSSVQQNIHSLLPPPLDSTLVERMVRIREDARAFLGTENDEDDWVDDGDGETSSDGSSSDTSSDDGVGSVSSSERWDATVDCIAFDIRYFVTLAELIESHGVLEHDTTGESFDPKDDEGYSLAPAFLISVQRTLDREFEGYATEHTAYLRQRFEQTIIVRWRRICYRNHRYGNLLREDPSLVREDEAASASKTAESVVAPAVPGAQPSPDSSLNPAAEAVAQLTGTFQETLAPFVDTLAAPITVARKNEKTIPLPQRSNIQRRDNMLEFNCPICRVPQQVKTNELRQAWEYV